MNARDEDYMRLALEQAKVALDNGWIPVGAVFVKDHRVIVHGRKTGEVHPLFDHAEHNACYQALWGNREGPKNLAGVTVYSTLEPCLMCLSMLMTTRVNRIVYGLSDPYGGGGFVLTHPHLPPRFCGRQPIFEGGIMAEASRELLHEFFARQQEAGHWDDPDNALIKLVMS